MNRKRAYVDGQGRRNERGQGLVVMVIWIFFALAMAAVVVDLGTVYVSYRQLQASTDAAALAGGQALPAMSVSAASSAALIYGGLSGGYNTYNNLSNVTVVSGYPKFACSTTLSGAGLPCNASTPVYNAMTVKQQAKVPLHMLSFFTSAVGAHPSLNISTTSMASGRMAGGGPYNIVVIVDTTVSMQSPDGDAANNPNCSGNSKIMCALSGVQTFLENVTPCATSTTCAAGTDTNDNLASPLNEVALMVFPGFVESGGSVISTELPAVPPAGTYPWQVADEYNGSSTLIGSSNISGYSLYSTTSAMIEEYEIVPFSSDYWATTATTYPAALNTSSDLVKAVKNAPYYSGAPGGPPWGLADKGGAGTFYAGIITAAQDALLAEQASRNNGSTNVIILLSDGNAGGATINTTSPSLYTNANNSNECTQAVTAAQAATAAGTTVYAVAYGAESSGCSGDSTYNPCSTMKAIASNTNDFFSDDTTAGSGAGCVGTALTSSNLQQIFAFIANRFRNSRLMPNGTP